MLLKPGPPSGGGGGGAGRGAAGSLLSGLRGLTSTAAAEGDWGCEGAEPKLAARAIEGYVFLGVPVTLRGAGGPLLCRWAQIGWMGPPGGAFEPC